MRVSLLFGAASGMSYAQEPARPVSKVIALLEKMQTQLTEEKENEEVISEKMSCWCDKTVAEKETAIADAAAHLKELDGTITELTGDIGSLTAEIEQLEKDIKSDQESLAQMTKIRGDEAAKFNQEEKDLLQSISALQAAVTVLKKHQSFMQSGTSLAAVANKLRVIVDGSFSDRLTDMQRRSLREFIQQPTFNEYSSQSGGIFGILEQMLETFQGDLKTARDDEAQALADFNESKKLKEESIATATKEKEDKEVLAGEKLSKLEASKEDHEATTEQKEADEEFLTNTQMECAKFSDEYDARVAERATELKAVATALEYLKSDEAHDLFARTFNFVQVSAVKQQRARAAAVLRAAGAKYHNPALTVLAQGVKAEAFKPIIEAIDKMVGDLKQQMSDDVADKDACVAELNQLDSDIADQTRNKEDFEAKKDSLEKSIAILEDEIKALQTNVAETKAALKEAGATREQENAEFQTAVKNQTDSIDLLNKALNVLKQVYATMPELLQQKVEPTPEGFKGEYRKNAGGGGVLGMISEIIADAEQAKALAIQGENDSQTSYEKLVKDSNMSIKKYETSITEKEDTKTLQNKERLATEADLKNEIETLTTTTETRKNRADECQFLLNNFDIRQGHMTGEVDALNQAKAFLQGMK